MSVCVCVRLTSWAASPSQQCSITARTKPTASAPPPRCPDTTIQRSRISRILERKQQARAPRQGTSLAMSMNQRGYLCLGLSE